ncbi:MAG: SPFH domain-containing protein [Treponema sp.]|nr:SPFH domain-containing protein [Treponema sp.]
MFRIRFAKFEPTLYVFKYKKGRITTQGEGLSFRYYAPGTTLVAVPIGSVDASFMFSETSADFQELTIQGQMTYRISDPVKTAKMLNYTIDSFALSYISDDPAKLPERLINLAQIAAKGAVKRLSLKEAIVSSDSVAQSVYKSMTEDNMVKNLGVQVLSLSIAAIKPNPETAKALEAETREEILKESDEAIFRRRNYAVEQERVIRESELNTEIAVENKNREIQETRMETKRLAQQKQLEMKETELRFTIQAEEQNRALVDLRTRNERTEADAKAYALREIMKVYQEVPAEVLKALTSAGIDSGRLMALAFQGIADKADKIGNLNITPDLLNTIIGGNGD